MFNFREFVTVIVANIREYLPDDYAEAEVTTNTVVKNNGCEKTALMIKRPFESVVPNIFLEPFFDVLENGGGMEDILSDIASVRIANDFKGVISLHKMFDFEAAKDNIFCKLINKARNSELLSNVPFSTFQDLAIIYCINTGEVNGSRGSVTITNDILDKLGVSKETLHEVALKNLSGDVTIKPIHEVLLELMPGFDVEVPESEIPLWIISNKDKLHGAASILDKDTLRTLAEKFGGNFTVIPSSIHECIVTPITDAEGVEMMSQMVKDINSTELRPEDVLSDSLYFYNAEEERFICIRQGINEETVVA
jgi:hypothetical protein